MSNENTADVSKMFPDYDKAIATREGQTVTVALWSGGTYSTLDLDIEHIFQSLDDMRRLGPQTKQR